MTQKFQTHYQMSDGATPLAGSFFNLVFSDLDQRLHGQELLEKDWRAALALLSEFGLERIDQTLAPVLAQFQDIASFGFLTATLQNDDPIIFDLGEKTVQINEGGERTYFAVSPFVALQAAEDPDFYAIARCMEYDRQTGALLIDIVSRSAALDIAPGPHAGVTVSVLPGGWGALHMLADNARTHRLAAEISAATAYASAGAAQILSNTTEDMRDQSEAARDLILGMIPGGAIPLASEHETATAALTTGLNVLASTITPKLAVAYLVCQTAELGYAVGDLVPVSAAIVGGTVSANNQPGIAAALRTSVSRGLRLYLPADGGLRIARLDTGAPAAITYANWRLRAYFWG